MANYVQSWCRPMNAYELADGLSKMYIETDNHGLFNKRIQNMLRQQADRIAELEKEIGVQAWLSQTKPLSDEEIIEIRDSCYVQSGIDEWEFDDVVFARAIEERI